MFYFCTQSALANLGLLLHELLLILLKILSGHLTYFYSLFIELGFETILLLMLIQGKVMLVLDASNWVGICIEIGVLESGIVGRAALKGTSLILQCLVLV